jgi:3-deoxy-D-manno-octulosonic-acid transferase
LPDVTTPNKSAPGTTTPDTSAPDTNTSDTTMSDTNVSDTNMSDTTTPDTTTPDMSAPGMSARLLSVIWAATATLAAPALRLSLRRRAARGKELTERLAERRGIDATPRPPGRLIWLHAASVGETNSLLPVLEALAVGAPDLTILVTTGTVTSAELLVRRLPELGLSERVLHRFAPLDVPAWAGAFLDHWRPDAAGFVESELWPNQILGCRARGIPLVLVNGRLSARSHAAWRRVPGLARHVLRSFRWIRARGEEDAARFRALGAANVEVPGDLKFAASPLPADEAELASLRTTLTGRPVWLAASTHPGEEAIVAAAHHRLAAARPGLLTIIAPRHPDRGSAIAATCQAARRGAGAPPPDQGIWIADTLGEMGLWYRLAQVAFVGRSLLPPGGGQNPLEPARLGCPIIVGPHTGNFTDHVALLREAEALLEVADADGLAESVAAVLDNPARRQFMAEQAIRTVMRHEELPAHTASVLLGLLRRG